ncbi:MAG: response regulator [Thermoflavifilum aggregans]|nr:response regulator [Thermoflavifilum aggregans]
MYSHAFRVLVVDDEPDSHAIISMMLSRQDLYPVETCLYAADLFQAELMMHIWHPDWIIVDLDLTETHGFSVAERMHDMDETELTFITAHERNTAQILAFSEIHLLLKPLNKKALMDVLQDMLIHQPYHEKHIRLATLKHNITQTDAPPMLAVPVQLSWMGVSINDIVHISQQDGFALLGLENTRLLAEKSFDDYLRLFIKLAGFLQIHPMHLVQLNHVAEIDTDHREVLMNNGTVLPVAAHKLQTLLQAVPKF